MKKIIRLTESDLRKVVNRVLNEAGDELTNQYFSKIKNALESMGFKLKEYDEKGSFANFMYSGKNPFDNYQHATLQKGSVSVKYPYTEVEGGPIEKDVIRVIFRPKGQIGNQGDLSKIDSMIFNKYRNSILSPQIKGVGLSGNGDYKIKVADVNSVLGVVNDLLKM